MGAPISVLILNYNADTETHKRCVASVEASGCDDLLELVIADNGSTEYPDAPASASCGGTRNQPVALSSGRLSISSARSRSTCCGGGYGATSDTEERT
jgi:hypothetical protein